ncbi:MAG: TetR/AcrR family transcriptional regulator [Lachnospiraceae bacterium]|nr:TetR/AcrR family transcriptional regulator [Lachnospiraceae bacterium]
MDTKHRILEEALTLFSEKGYSNVFVNDIAERVGIKAPSLYKHYKNKQAIFDAIIAEMHQRFLDQAQVLNIQGNDPFRDAEIYSGFSEEQLIRLGTDLFLYYLHDDYIKKFRKMLTIEQFRDPSLGAAYSKLYVDDPLTYQGQLLAILVSAGVLHGESTETMALHFYSPLYLLLTICDRDPSREEEAIRILEGHIREFNRLYGRTKE